MPDTKGMISAQFTGHREALEWRSKFGGWVFLADSGAAMWFGPSYTPSAIMLSPLTRGMSGGLR